MTEQHDHHIWLTVYGENWAIHRIGRGARLMFYLWRGYEPNLQFLTIEMAEPDWDGYCAAAVAMLDGTGAINSAS